MRLHALLLMSATALYAVGCAIQAPLPSLSVTITLTSTTTSAATASSTSTSMLSPTNTVATTATPTTTLTLQERQLAVLRAIKPDFSWPEDVCHWIQPSDQKPQDIVACDEQGHIIRLVLYDMGITNLPPEIGQLTGLKLLGLGFNNLTSLPPEIGELSRLEYLNLAQL